MNRSVFRSDRQEAGGWVESMDWSGHPLGPPDRWPISLTITLGTLLNSKQPMFLFWGQQSYCFYNDGYIPILGLGKHPWALGRPGSEVWKETWPMISPLVKQALEEGRASWHEDHLVPVVREGKAEEAYFTYSYSPVFLEDGSVGGTLVTCTETTEKVLAVRRASDSEQAFRLALTSADMGAWYIDLRTHEITASPELSRILGVDTLGEDVFDSMERCIHPEDRERTRRLFRESLERRIPYDNEYRIVRPDGETRWILSRGQAILGPRGEAVAVSGITVDITDRKRRAELEAAANRELVSTLETMTEGYSAYDRDYVLTGLNSETERFLGRPRNEILGKKAEELFPSRDRRKFEAHYDRIMATGVPERFIETYEGRSLQVHAYRARNGGVNAFFRDITDQVAAQDQLRLSQERFRMIAEAIPNLVWTSDASGAVTFYNQRWHEYTGLGWEEAKAWGWQRTLHPADFEASIRQWRKSVATGEPLDWEHRVRRARDGEYRWHIVRAIPMRDASGAIVEWLGTLTDIHDLRRSEVELRNLADAMPQIVWSADAAGRTTYLNARWYEYTGEEPGPLAMRSQAQFIHPEDLPAATSAWEEAQRRRAPFAISLRLRGTTGEYRWFMSRAVPIFDPETTGLRAWYGTSTDIQDQKQIQAELEEAVRARDEFLSIASHELKTPLTSLGLQAQLLKRKIEKGDPTAYGKGRVDQLAEHTHRQVHRLNRLVDDMLDITRIRSGKLTLVRQRFDLCELVRETVNRMQSQFLESGCGAPEVTYCEPAEGEWDRLRLEQVLSNLFTNAIRYGQGKPVQVGVECLQGETRLSVRDQGIGIAPEAQAKIFDRFERAVDANEVSGLGLGLFITRQIVEAHQGRVWVESEVGRGSTFFVALPCAR